MSKLQKKNMSKLQKNISIIFLLFFIYYLISKTFSLKFREGAKCSESRLKDITEKCDYYKNHKSKCKTAFKSACKKKKCSSSFYGIKYGPLNLSCKDSQCLRPYGTYSKKGCVGDGGNEGQDDIYGEENPCMGMDFCKNCKKCYDDNKNKDKIPLKDGTDFDCKKCLHSEDKQKKTTTSDKTCLFGVICLG